MNELDKSKQDDFNVPVDEEVFLPLRLFSESMLRGLRKVTDFGEFHRAYHNFHIKATLISHSLENMLPEGQRPPKIGAGSGPFIRTAFRSIAMMMEDARILAVLEAGETGTFLQYRDAWVKHYEDHLNKVTNTSPETVESIRKKIEEHRKTCPNCRGDDDGSHNHTVH